MLFILFIVVVFVVDLWIWKKSSFYLSLESYIFCSNLFFRLVCFCFLQTVSCKSVFVVVFYSMRIKLKNWNCQQFTKYFYTTKYIRPLIFYKHSSIRTPACNLTKKKTQCLSFYAWFPLDDFFYADQIHCDIFSTCFSARWPNTMNRLHGKTNHKWS